MRPLAVVLVLLALAVPAYSYLAHNPGCRTRRCDWHVWRWWAEHRLRRTETPLSGESSTTASWYDQWEGPTACGPHEALGVANKTMPCGTRVRICHEGCEVAVVDDRGPFVAGRELDLSA